MKKNKKGFTLAEILITLGIVGVISALVLPQISKVNDKTFEPTRERTINVLQEGFAKLLHQAQQGNDDAMTTMLSAITNRDVGINAQNVLIVQSGTTNLFNQCQGLLGIVPVQMTAAERSAYLNSMHWFNAQNQEQSLITKYPRLRNAVVYKFAKINSVIIFEPFFETGQNFENEHAVIARIFIDADGMEGRNLLDAPNQSKRGDIGVYGLGNDGFIYRDNSEECQAYDGGCRKP